jgi:anti-anti-sigma regulatory factor
VSLLEVSVEAGNLGTVVVLAGDADDSSLAQLNEVLAAQVSARTTHLTIDATNLRSIDPATAQILMLAVLIVMVQGGSTVLMNPQEPILAMLNHPHTKEMFTIRSRTPSEIAPDTIMDGGRAKGPMSMADHEHEPDWSIKLRRQPASLSIGHPEGNTTGTFEVICRECGDHPDLDYPEVPPALRQIRGPYPLTAGIAACLKHQESHDRAEKTEACHARPDLAIPHRPLSHTAARYSNACRLRLP